MFATASQIAINTPARFSLTSFAQTVALWAGRSSQRRVLAALTVDELKDVGIDQAAAATEAAKPFWAA